MAVPDEYLAFNGTTVLGQIDNLKREEVEKEREMRDREREMLKKDARPPQPLLKKQQSTKQYRMVPNHHHNTSAWNIGTQSVPVSRAATPPILPSLPMERGRWAKEKEKGMGRVVGKRKSFFNIFGSARREGGGG